MLTRYVCLGLWVLQMVLPAVTGLGAPASPLESVDPRIGTAHSRWFFFTPGGMPFGMARPGPCTDAHYGNKDGWQAVGYDGRHESIESFVSFREFQIGGVAVMATTGPLQTTPGKLEHPDDGYRSRFDKAEEIAQPGYYSVRLKDYGVRAELTATPRVAYHRFTFPASDQAHLIFDVGHRQGESGAVLDAFVRRVGELEVEGSVTTHPEYIKAYQPGALMRLYFVARLDKAPSKWGAFRGAEVYPGQTSLAGPGAGLYASFETRAGEAVVLQVGLSFTSLANARHNLDREAANLDFDGARRRNQEQWASLLGRIEVEGGRDSDRVKFYTGLYHALQGRGLASDANGAYPRNDGGVGQIPLGPDGLPLYHHYNSDSVWGTFWNLNLLWALAYPEYLRDYIRCHLDHFRDCGWLPDSIAAAKFVSGVGTDYMGLLVSTAYRWGVRGYDPEKAFAAVWNNEMGWQNRPKGVGKADIKAFLDRGYVPLVKNTDAYSGSDAEGSQFSASHTLEYSFSAFAAAQFARALGKTNEAARLLRNSHGWEHLYDTETGFIRPKDADGRFMAEFNPRKAWVGFQEANAWQYTFYVPHDPAGLIQKMSQATFTERLDHIFKQAEETKFGGGTTVDAFAGVENVYNHGNQPGLHISWLFNYGGQPWRTQYWVRRICDVFYGTDAVHGYGYGQDEDQGQLGAWFVLAGLGLFDVQGGAGAKQTLQLASPLFSKIRLRLHPDFYPGKLWEIRVAGDPARDQYIQSARLNNQPLDRCWIPWETLVKGGALDLVLGEKANQGWGAKEPPPSGVLPE
jgi:predicted alpha-1,2-mannosidase